MAGYFNPDANYTTEINKAKSKGASSGTIKKLESERANKIASANDEQLSKWKIDRSGYDTKKPKSSNGASSISDGQIAALKAHGQTYRNDITVIKGNSSHKIDAVVYDNHSYDANTGERLFSYDSNDTGGKYSIDDVNSSNKDWKRDKHGEYGHTSTIRLKDDVPKHDRVYKPQRPYIPPRPPIPPKPPFRKIGLEEPSFNSDIKKVKRYSTSIIVNDISIKNVKLNKNSYYGFISNISEKEVEGDILRLEYMSKNFDSNNSSIELYINDTPIVNSNCEKDSNMNCIVRSEKIFFGKDTLFNNIGTICIKVNGNKSLKTIEDIQKEYNNNDLYTIDYTTNRENCLVKRNDLFINSDSASIKVIIRYYDDIPPVISGLVIKNYS